MHGSTNGDEHPKVVRGDADPASPAPSGRSGPVSPAPSGRSGPGPQSDLGPRGRLLLVAIVAGSTLAGIALLTAGLQRDGWIRLVLVTLAASFVVSTVVGTVLVLCRIRIAFAPNPGSPPEGVERAAPTSGGVRRTPEGGMD